MQKWYKWVREHFALHCTVCVHLKKKNLCVCALCVIWDVPLCIWHFMKPIMCMWVTLCVVCHCVGWWPSCMSHSTHFMFLICQCHDEFFSAFGFMHTNTYRTSVPLSVQHTWYVHTLTLSFFLISTRATKSNSNTYFLGDGDKSCVGGVSWALRVTAP